MNEEQLKAFALEISTFGNIPISSRNCGIGCIYCKVHTDPVLKKYPSLPDITLEELYQGFKFVDNNSKYLRLGAGVLVAPQTDPYLHPDIYNFIEHTCNAFPQKKITTVTTGSYIDERKIDFLSSFSNFGIDLSLVTMQKDREKIVPKSTRERILFLLKNATLNKVTLMFTGEIDILKQDLELIHSFDLHNKAKEILVRRIEYTKFSNVKLNSVANRSIENYESCVEFLKSEHPNIIYTVPYLKDVFRGGNNEYFIQADDRIGNLKLKIALENRKINVLCSESAYEYFSKQLSACNNVQCHLIKNQLYAGSVTVAGLLNIKDIINQFQKSIPDHEIITLPYEMFNSEMTDILGSHYTELQNYYKAEIWIM